MQEHFPDITNSNFSLSSQAKSRLSYSQPPRKNIYKFASRKKEKMNEGTRRRRRKKKTSSPVQVHTTLFSFMYKLFLHWHPPNPFCLLIQMLYTVQNTTEEYFVHKFYFILNIKSWWLYSPVVCVINNKKKGKLKEFHQNVEVIAFICILHPMQE